MAANSTAIGTPASPRERKLFSTTLAEISVRHAPQLSSVLREMRLRPSCTAIQHGAQDGGRDGRDGVFALPLRVDVV
jgi:hypothetical protein